MPHIIVECSQPLKSKLPFQDFLPKLHHILADSLPAKLENCKSRVLAYNDDFIGSDPDALFIHLTVKILAGRTEQIKKNTGEKIFAKLVQLLADFEVDNVSISTEILDLSPHYFKTIRTS